MTWEHGAALSIIVVNVMTSIFAILTWWKARKIDVIHKEVKAVKQIINGHDRDG